MMRFILAPFAALLAVFACAVPPAAAQLIYPVQPPRYGPGYQTQLSPYLNLLRGGDPAANYYLGVVKEFQRREDRRQIYGSLQALNQLPARPQLREPDIGRPLGSTGHPTAFGYTGTYFGGGAQAGRAPGNPFPARTPAGQQGGSRWPNYSSSPTAMPPTFPPTRR